METVDLEAEIATIDEIVPLPYSCAPASSAVLPRLSQPAVTSPPPAVTDDSQEDDPDLLHQQLQSQQDGDQEVVYEAPPPPYSSAPAASAVLPRLSPPAVTDDSQGSLSQEDDADLLHQQLQSLQDGDQEVVYEAPPPPYSSAFLPQSSSSAADSNLEQQEQPDRNFSRHGPSNSRSISAPPSPVQHPLPRTTSDPTPATATANLDDSPRRVEDMREDELDVDDDVSLAVSESEAASEEEHIFGLLADLATVEGLDLRYLSDSSLSSLSSTGTEEKLLLKKKMSAAAKQAVKLKVWDSDAELLTPKMAKRANESGKGKGYCRKERPLAQGVSRHRPRSNN